MLLQIKNVTKKYKNKTALAGVSLDIARGEILTLLGANGAGKTTLSSIIASLQPPTSGDIIWNDQSIYNDLISYRMMIGYCPQKPNFASRMTVKQHLLFAGKYYLLDKKTIEERVKLLMSQFNLEQYADASPDVLSDGV